MKTKVWKMGCLAASCLMVFSCTEKKAEGFVPDEVVKMDVIDGYVDEVLDTTTYLPLEVSESAVLSRVHKLLADDGLYFLADFNHAKIAVYTHEGKLKYVLDKRGHGQGEYMEIMNFTVDEVGLYIIDNYRHKIHIYDKHTGAYVESKPTDLIASDMAPFGEDGFLFSVIPNGQKMNIEQPENLVILTDKDFKVKDAYFPYDGDYCEPLSRRSYFSLTENGVLFSSFLFDGGTEFMHSEKQSVRQVLMELKHAIPEDSRTKMESYGGSSLYAFVAETPIVCGQYWFVDVTTEEKNSLGYVYDTKEGKLYGNDYRSADKSPLAFIVGSDDEHFISYIPDEAYYDEMVKYGLPKADSLTKECLQQGGSALLLYQMK